MLIIESIHCGLRLSSHATFARCKQMAETPLQLHPIDESAIARIDAALAAHGLLVTMKGTLKSYPGCTHWHCKSGNEKGTLEITLWPAQKRAWFKVQSG